MGGHWLDLATQKWVWVTGRTFDPISESWLTAPAGPEKGIGEGFFEELAQREGWTVDESSTPRGLIDSMAALSSPVFDPTKLHPAVTAFYELTSEYQIDAWSEWSGVFRPFGWLLAVLFSRRLQQLNVPLTGLDASRGMTSRVLKLRGAAEAKAIRTAWVRSLKATGHVIYAGDYSVGLIPALGIQGVKVAFPLPNGNAIVLMRPEIGSDGSLTLSSIGKGFGDAGFYFTLHKPGLRARYLKHFRETIHVYASESEEVRADHVLKLFGVIFLRLHYRLIKVS